MAKSIQHIKAPEQLPPFSGLLFSPCMSSTQKRELYSYLEFKTNQLKCITRQMDHGILAGKESEILMRRMWPWLSVSSWARAHSGHPKNDGLIPAHRLPFILKLGDTFPLSCQYLYCLLNNTKWLSGQKSLQSSLKAIVKNPHDRRACTYIHTQIDDIEMQSRSRNQ